VTATAPRTDLGPFRALGFRFAISLAEPRLVTYFENLLAPFRTDENFEHGYGFVDHGSDESPEFALTFDGEELWTSSDPSLVVSYLLWHINRQVIERSGEYLLLHSAAAVGKTGAILLPAPPESGKSTVVAALVQAGLDYLTDEAAAIDPSTGFVYPYPKPLSLDPGSWSVLPDLEPKIGPDLKPFIGVQWQVAPNDIRPRSIAEPAQVRFVITPSYARGQTTSLVPVSRAKMLTALVNNSFNLASFGRNGFALLARVVAGSDCYTAAFSDVHEACDAILAVVDHRSCRTRGNLVP
jgi:hypothetical protein